MSRNVLYVLLGVIIVFLIFVLLGSRRNSTSQTGLISPTPVQSGTKSVVSPTVESSPTVSPTISVEPTISQAVVSPTIKVTTSPNP